MELYSVYIKLALNYLFTTDSNKVKCKIAYLSI